jgi:hypothetical protein
MCHHHATMKDLERAAMEACPVCFEIWNGLPHTQREKLLTNSVHGAEYATHALIVEFEMLGPGGSHGGSQREEFGKMIPKDGFFFTVAFEEKNELEKIIGSDPPQPVFVMVTASGTFDDI